VDGVASLRPYPIEVEFAGWVYTVDALPAADWVEAILSPHGGALFPGLLRDPERERQVWRSLATGEGDSGELIEATREMVSEAAGRPWWEVDRLVRSALHVDVRAVVLGKLGMRGLDPGRISLGLFCDAVYALLIENADQGQRMRIDMELRQPPPDASPEQVIDPEDFEREFMANLDDRGSG
jgi:hypothetical protein